MQNIEHIYIHIPYCDKICFYCDFVKQIIPKNEEDILKYLFLIKNELQPYLKKLNNVKSIYIGGGTPSALSDGQLKVLLDLFKDIKVDELTIEANPESLTSSKLKLLIDNNVNRLSIGVQTFNNELLKRIGRVHDRDKAIESFNLARAAGFNNISIDLIYNLPGQTQSDIENDLKFIEKLKPDHISWYSLIVKEDSIWGKMNLKKPENDEIFDILVNKGLEKLNYNRYEISNYCVNDKFSIHNLGYWKTNQFIGLGLGAHGYEFIDKGYAITKNIGTALNYKKVYEPVSLKDHYFNKIMMGLRLKQGIKLDQDIIDYYNQTISKLVKDNMLEFDGSVLKCTKQGFDLLNDVLLNFLEN